MRCNKQLENSELFQTQGNAIGMLQTVGILLECYKLLGDYWNFFKLLEDYWNFTNYWKVTNWGKTSGILEPHGKLLACCTLIEFYKKCIKCWKASSMLQTNEKLCEWQRIHQSAVMIIVEHHAVTVEEYNNNKSADN